MNRRQGSVLAFGLLLLLILVGTAWILRDSKASEDLSAPPLEEPTPPFLRELPTPSAQEPRELGKGAASATRQTPSNFSSPANALADSLAGRFEELMRRVRAHTDDELLELWGGLELEAGRKAPLLVELDALLEERRLILNAAVEEELATLDERDPNCATNEECFRAERTDAYVALASTPPGLIPELGEAFGAAVLDAAREPVRLFLAVGASGVHSDVRLVPELSLLMERALADGQIEVALELVWPLMSLLATSESDPGPTWRRIVEADHFLLVSLAGLQLARFPLSVVEPLLLEGLQHPSSNARFATMEAVRGLGARDKLDVPRFAGLLLEVVERYPEDSRLHLEAIGAIGAAEPVLAEFVLSDAAFDLRQDAAGFYVMHAEALAAESRLRAWLGGGPELRALALTALGLMQGEPGRALIAEEYAQSGSAAERAQLLRALTGRSEDDSTIVAEALRDPADSVRVAAVESLITALLSDTPSAEIATPGELGTLLRTDDSLAVRAQATLALGLEGSPGAQEVLKERFLAEDDAQVRGMAGAALLIRSLKDPELAGWWDGAQASESNPFVRSTLDDLRAQLGDPTQRQQLIDTIRARQSFESQVADALPEGVSKDPFSPQAGFDLLLLQLLSDEDS